MPYFTFDVVAEYVTDEIYAESEEEAKEIAFDELQYNGEERDTTFKLRKVWYDDDEKENDDD